MSQKPHHILLPVLAALLIAVSHGYPGGAPSSVCGTLQPNVNSHGGMAQNTTSPYNLAVSQNSVVESDTVTVTVGGEETLKFRGIFLQARKSGETTAYGSFTGLDSDFKNVECSGIAESAVTHSNNTEKPVPQNFMWTVPSGLSGEIEFVATIVQTRDTYWVNITSAAVTVTEDTEDTTASVETTTSAGSFNQFNLIQLTLAMAMGLSLLIG